jgi:hypothetical protein
MRDRLILQILSVQVDLPLLVVNFPVTRFFLSWMIISPSEIPTYFAETYKGYTNWQRRDFDERSTHCRYFDICTADFLWAKEARVNSQSKPVAISFALISLDVQ